MCNLEKWYRETLCKVETDAENKSMDGYQEVKREWNGLGVGIDIYTHCV